MPASARLQDHNGYLFVKGCPIASSGIFQYSAAQVGLPGDPGRIVNVYRPPEAVSDPEYLSSLQVIPLINDHEMLSGFAGDTSATAPEAYGLDGVLFDVGYAEPWVSGDLKIFTRSMQSDLNSGKKDLSLGYTCDFEVKSGTVDGQSFEVVQTNMRGNHIALVEVGRVPGARVLDGKRMCFDSLSFQSFTINGGCVMAHGKGGVPAKGKKTLDSAALAQFQALMQQLLPTFEQLMSEGAVTGAAQDPNATAQAGASAAPAAQPAADPNAAAQPAAGAENAAGAATAAPAATAPAGETGSGEVAAENATSATAAATPEGEEDAGAGAGDPNAIVGQIGELLKQLVATLGGAAEPAAKPAEAAPEQKDNGGEAGSEASGGEAGSSTENSGESANETNDNVEGLEPTVDEGEAGAGVGENGQGTASAGPAAGKHTGADAALRGFYADANRKASLVDRLSKVVGAFDGAFNVALATASDVASYGVKKLAIKCAKGQEYVALDAYLTAHAQAQRDTGVVPGAVASNSSAADSAAGGESVVSAYLKKVS